MNNNYKTIVVYEYLRRRSPSDETSEIRLRYMLYLADWKCAFMHGHTMTNLEWFYRVGTGPDPVNLDSVLFLHKNGCVPTPTSWWSRLKSLFWVGHELRDYERDVLNHVVRVSREKDLGLLRRLVYSTYPVLVRSGNDWDELKLVEWGQEYKECQL